MPGKACGVDSDVATKVALSLSKALAILICEKKERVADLQVSKAEHCGQMRQSGKQQHQSLGRS